MKTRELEKLLIEKGFNEGRLDTGCNYTYETEHLKLICYVETDIEAEFITIYHWKNNDVKGTYNITVDELKGYNGSIAGLFRKTKLNLPQFIGETIDTHEELEKVLNDIV